MNRLFFLNRTFLSLIGLSIVIIGALVGFFSSMNLDKEKNQLAGILSPKLTQKTTKSANISQKLTDFGRNFSSKTATSISYIYRAYYDDRIASNPKIRVLGFRECKFDSETVSMDFYFDKDQYQESSRAVLLTSLNGECPWHWAPACKLDSYYLSAPVPFFDGISPDPQKLTKIRLKNAEISLEISKISLISSEIAHNFSHELAVCVVPLYLYVDWLQMVQFLEIWTILGATKFTIYVTSITKTAYSLLEMYEKSGILEIVIWPLLPKTYTKSFNHDPNLSIYRFGHILAINDCLLRHVGVAKFVASVDFDEYILPKKNVDLVTVLNSLARFDPKAGSFEFHHTRLYYPSSYELPWSINLSTFNMQYLSHLRECCVKGPSKVILRPERTLITANHGSKRLLPGYQSHSVSRSYGELYHLRRSPTNPSKNKTVLEFRRFQKILSVAEESFKETVEKYWEKDKILKTGKEVLKAVTGCLSTWKNTGCKVPHEMCGKKVFANKTDWLIFESDGNQTTERKYDKFIAL